MTYFKPRITLDVMKIYLLFILLLTLGCAAITRRNIIELKGQSDVERRTLGNVIPAGEVLFTKEGYTLKISNLNSNLAYLGVGILIPFIPVHPFRDMTGDGRLKIEFLLESKNNTMPHIDFSTIAFEDFPNNHTPCAKYTIKEIIHTNEYEFIYFAPNLKYTNSPSQRLYQLDCELMARSIPEQEGTFLKIKGIKVVGSEAPFSLPELLISYRNSHQYEFFAPMK